MRSVYLPEILPCPSLLPGVYPVCLPWGALPMGDTPGSCRGVASEPREPMGSRRELKPARLESPILVSVSDYGRSTP
jgi:hypothetical protein